MGKDKFNIGRGVLMIFGGLIFVTVGTLIATKIQKSTNNQNTPPSVAQVACPPDLLSYTALSKQPNHVFPLISEHTSMFAQDGKFVNEQVVIAKSETSTSKVACGYLYIQAGTDKGKLFPQWEDVVVNPSGFGGHLIQDSAISVNDGPEYSEYLYSLNKIKYWDSHNRTNEFTADWASLLNASDQIPFTIALNTINKTGFINKVSIAYKCWDPSTGKENDGCSLNEVSRTKTYSNNIN